MKCLILNFTSKSKKKSIEKNGELKLRPGRVYEMLLCCLFIYSKQRKFEKRTQQHNEPSFNELS
jgi:hypothetical protein